MRAHLLVLLHLSHDRSHRRHRLPHLLPCLSRLVRALSLMMKHQSDISQLKHLPPSRHCLSGMLLLQYLLNVMFLRNRREHLTSAPMKVRHTQHHRRDALAVFLRFLVAAHLFRRGHHLRRHLKCLRLSPQSQRLKTMNAERATMRATTILTSPPARNTRTP